MGVTDELQGQASQGLRVVFAPLITFCRQLLGLFVYGFGFFCVCLAPDYLPWPIAIAVVIGGLVLIALGLSMARIRDHLPLGERIAAWRKD